MPDSNDNTTNYVMLAIVAIVAVAALVFFMQPRDSDTRLESAVEDVADGIDDAADEINPPDTPGEKFGNAVEELGDDIQDAAD